jgi:hypothetical protein
LLPCKGIPQGPRKKEGATKVAKHKTKEKEKSDKKAEKGGADSHNEKGAEAEGGKAKGEGKKKKKKNKEEIKNGDGIKRPLSAYMLYNNYRRPVLRKEHPSNINILTFQHFHFPKYQS